MKRFHVHVSVENLAESIRFYSALFHRSPAVEKSDYAKWMLDDPFINFAISARGGKAGLDHLGFQVENDEELQHINERLTKAELPIKAQTGTSCCYAKSDKYWTVDPQGIAWEAFHTLAEVPTFNRSTPESPIAEEKACCVPISTVFAKGPLKKGCC